MSDHQIRIDITADDDASKVLEEVADDAEQLEKLAPEVTVTADTDTAAQALDELAGTVDTLDRLSPTVEVTADTAAAAGDIDQLVSDIGALPSPTVEVAADTSTARGDVQALADDVETLSRQDTEILLRARIDDAKASLKALRDDLGKTEKAAEDTKDEFDRMGGKIPKGQAIGDLTGPLGDVSSKASEISGVFDGINDLTEGFASKIGLSQGAADKLAGAIGGLGLGVTAAVTVWGYFHQKQDEAKRKQQELIDKTKEFQELLENGKFQEAGQQMVDMYGDAMRQAELAGIPIQEVTDFLAGFSDELPTAEARLKTMNQQWENGDTSVKNMRFRLETATTWLQKTRDGIDDANGTLKTQKDRLDGVTGALRDGYTPGVEDAKDETKKMRDEVDRTKDALDKMEGALDMERAFLNFQEGMSEAMKSAEGDANLTSEEILDIKDDILNVAEAAQLTPIEVRTLLQKVDEGNLAYVQRSVEAAWARSEPEVTMALRSPTQADVDRIKADLRAKFGTLGVPVEPRAPGQRNGDRYTGPR